MGKYARKTAQALKARQSEVPASGDYRTYSGKYVFFRKPGSQNRKKGYGARGRRR